MLATAAAAVVTTHLGVALASGLSIMHAVAAFFFALASFQLWVAVLVQAARSRACAPATVAPLKALIGFPTHRPELAFKYEEIGSHWRGYISVWGCWVAVLCARHGRLPLAALQALVLAYLAKLSPCYCIMLTYPGRDGNVHGAGWNLYWRGRLAGRRWNGERLLALDWHAEKLVERNADGGWKRRGEMQTVCWPHLHLCHLGLEFWPWQREPPVDWSSPEALRLRKDGKRAKEEARAKKDAAKAARRPHAAAAAKAAPAVGAACAAAVGDLGGRAALVALLQGGASVEDAAAALLPFVRGRLRLLSVKRSARHCFQRHGGDGQDRRDRRDGAGPWEQDAAGAFKGTGAAAGASAGDGGDGGDGNNADACRSDDDETEAGCNTCRSGTLTQSGGGCTRERERKHVHMRPPEHAHAPQQEPPELPLPLPLPEEEEAWEEEVWGEALRAGVRRFVGSQFGKFARRPPRPADA
jgi:hypothetical protein